MKYLLSVSLCLALSLTFNVRAQPEDVEYFPDAAFIYETFASEYCEPVPSNIDPVELANMRQLILDNEYPIVQAEVTGFMAGERFGISPFGFAAPGRGFASVATIWGEHEELGVVTLCIAMIQVGDQVVEPGRSRLVGLREIDTAEPGDMLAAGWVITLNPTERLSASGDPVYRLERIGEVVISEGLFNLTSVDEQGFKGNFSFEGWVALREQEQEQEQRFPLTVQATAAGENVIEKVPSLTQKEEAVVETPAAEPDRDYSQLPVPKTSRDERERPRLDHDAPRREAFYGLLQIDLPRKAEAPIEGDVDDWNWLQDRRFRESVEQSVPFSMELHQLVHHLVDLRDQAGEEFAIVWDPDRLELAIWFEYFDEKERYVTRSMSFSFNEAGTMVSRSGGARSTASPPDHYRYADNYGVLFGQPHAPAVLESAPIVRVALERDTPLREAFYRLLDIDLPRKAAAGPDSEAPGWEAAQKAAFEALVAERFPADMTPQAVAEQLMAMRKSVDEVFALIWDPNRRSLITKYEYQGTEGYIARTMDFLFNEAGEQVFFGVGGESRRSAPRSFPATDDLGALAND